VYDRSAEISLSMTESLLLHLGATHEQVDRERTRIREELFGGGPPSDVPVTVPTVETGANIDPSPEGELVGNG